ncbi:SpvB/TcaC N-terminal domain-containing protein, partial [Labrys sp. KB_33_2]|uniref:SpvB/TcaC N-terminal domain-containing protein n=1 Tax=Labrys sp. KB_33_2 TaxID=3237479 RepID=UPI003F8F9D78
MSLRVLMVAGGLAGALAPSVTALGQSGSGSAGNPAAMGGAPVAGAPSVPTSDPTIVRPAPSSQPGISTSQPPLLPDLMRVDPAAAGKAAASQRGTDGSGSGTGSGLSNKPESQAGTSAAKGAAGSESGQGQIKDGTGEAAIAPEEGAADAPAQSLAPMAATATVGDAGDALKALASTSALATKAEPASFNGSFTQSVSIAVPVYHGLEPKLSLRYDSNAGARAGGYWAGLAGVGFSLSGLSDITRSSAVGGAPRYADTDEFVLDGDRLVACTAGMTSPACTTGAAGAGVSYYATRVESFVRVKRIVSGTTTSWEVAARDGTVSTYVSPASVPGWYTNGATPSSDAQLRDDTRWLLRKVRDTHGNEVGYDYACVGDPICWPASISYNGTRIAFNLEATSGA